MSEIETKSSKQNLSLGKAMGILDIMVTYRKPMRLLDIAKDTGITSSTLYRFLNSFIEYGYVKRDEQTQMYSLTLKLASMGFFCRQNYQITGNLQSYVERISIHFSESASLCIEEGMQVVYVAIHEGPTRMLSTLSRIGKIAPMHCTGTGKVFLSAYTEEQLQVFVNKMGLQRFTPKTICSIEELKKELDIIRHNGYAWDDEECEMGAKCLAVPIFDYSGSIVAAFSFSCPTQRFPGIGEAIAFMKEISMEASKELGYTA